MQTDLVSEFGRHFIIHGENNIEWVKEDQTKNQFLTARSRTLSVQQTVGVLNRFENAIDLMTQMGHKL